METEKICNMLKISQYLNDRPRATVKNVLKFCRLNNILKSNDAVYNTLQYMERNRIIMNPRIFLKNCTDHRNVHCIIRTEDTDKFMKSIVKENRDSIKAVYQSRHGNENALYVKSTKLLFLRDFEIVEEIEWESHNVIFPWKWNDSDNILSNLPDTNLEKSLPLKENLTTNPGFEITGDINTLLYWLKINLRLRDVHLMKETGFSHRKIKIVRDAILANSVVYFPIFIHKFHHYVSLYFSFFTDYYTFLMKFFSRNSGTSFLIRGKNNRTFLFINTTMPGWILRAMEYFEDIGIVRTMLFYYLQKKWDPILEDFSLGKIPEKYFWMFGVPRKKIDRK